MTMTRRQFSALAVLGAGRSRNGERPDSALSRAARFLWNQQAEDGGWHSTTYGLLGSGQSLTPFVLEALLRVPATIFAPPPEKAARAWAFLNRSIDAGGAVGRHDPVLEDYPNYATALAVLALCRARPPGWEQTAGRMVSYLRRQQFAEENGWRRDDAAYGAWGMGGEPRRPPHPGHVDLSMTRHVVQALAETGVPSTDPALERARVFVERCQNFGAGADGGFFFSTVVLGANKAGREGERYRSYGSATADGILCLLALGYSQNNKRVQAAQRWLVAHHQPWGVPGFIGEAYQRWSSGLRFYYAAASAEAFHRLKVWPRGGLHLEAHQRADGSWANEENLVKEDDPLIATAFAVRALVNAPPGS